MPDCTCLRCGQQRTHEARGLCDPCYQWVKRSDQLDRYPRSLRTPAEWVALIDTRDPAACWPWPGPMNGNGYGNAGSPAHRVVYELKVGPIPDGYQVGHTCHDRADCAGGIACAHRLCVNWVQHLKPMTRTENLLATPNTFNAINAGRTACPQGHPYDDVNTEHRNGRRHCRQCARDRRRRNYYANLEVERARAREYQRARRTQHHAPVAATGIRQA